MTYSPTLDDLLQIMIDTQASDLYITSAALPSIRVQGLVQPIAHSEALHAQQCEYLANACMNNIQRQDFLEKLEMNLAIVSAIGERFRVNIFRQRGDVGMVVRHIHTEIPSLEQLGLPESFKNIMQEKRGIIIVAGATSSGKSTSLAAMIDYRNTHIPGHIITIEDPVEFVHAHKRCVINQREIGTDTLSYSEALKNTLRQAPDVILIGEIRDRDTMEYALQFAETGHLCMATIHANNANQALERIMNFFPEEVHPQTRMNLSLNMKAIFSQRLVRTLDEKRIAAIEVLLNTPRVADLIDQWDIHEIKEVMADGALYGMQTFDQHLIQLWEQQRISLETAIANADSVNDVRLAIKMSTKSTPATHPAESANKLSI